MKLIYTSAILFFLLPSCSSNEPKAKTKDDGSTNETLVVEEEVIPFDDTIVLPKDWTILQEIKGDLDKDGVEERVIAYNTGPFDQMENLSCARELRIFKKGKEKWEMILHSQKPIYASDAGGMMGDPFDEMKIQKGVLVISQQGGSRYKWGFTNKYRFQNGDFYMIGASSIYGTPCEYWQTVDYNLSTGKIEFELEPEECGEELSEYEAPDPVHKLFDRPVKKKIKLVNYTPGELLIQVPGYAEDVYL